MDATEAHVKRYLHHLGFRDVVYEPDGNVPPDFLAEGRIAIEARRLNQHETSGGVPRGLEETRIPLVAQIRSLLEEIGAIDHAPGWFLTFRLERPLLRWKTVRPQVAAWLRDVAAEPLLVPHRAKFGTLSFTLVPATTPLKSTFVLGGFTDRDAGGWVLYELRRNIQICIEEKSRKAAAYRAKYPEWWLVLVDHIEISLDEHERGLLKEQHQAAHGWNRVVLLDRNDHTSMLEVGIAQAAG